MKELGGVLGLLLIFYVVFEYFRGMQALREIATSLKRIEEALSKGSPGVPNPPPRAAI